MNSVKKDTELALNASSLQASSINLDLR